MLVGFLNEQQKQLQDEAECEEDNTLQDPHNRFYQIEDSGSTKW